jgi:hypothetical protein
MSAAPPIDADASIGAGLIFGARFFFLCLLPFVFVAPAGALLFG